MRRPTALAACIIRLPTASLTTRAEPVAGIVGTPVIGFSGRLDAATLSAPLTGVQSATAEGAGVAAFAALIAHGFGVSVASPAGVAVTVAATVVAFGAFPVSPFVFVTRSVAGGEVRRVPALVEPPPVVCVEVAACESNDCTMAGGGEGVSVTVGSAVAIAVAAVTVGETIAEGVGVCTGFAEGIASAVAVGALVAVG